MKFSSEKVIKNIEQRLKDIEEDYEKHTREHEIIQEIEQTIALYLIARELAIMNSIK